MDLNDVDTYMCRSPLPNKPILDKTQIFETNEIEVHNKRREAYKLEPREHVLVCTCILVSLVRKWKKKMKKVRQTWLLWVDGAVLLDVELSLEMSEMLSENAESLSGLSVRITVNATNERVK